MKYAYFLDNQGAEDTRSNSSIFQLITEFSLPDEQVFDDETLDRPEFIRLFNILGEGDTLIIRSVLDVTDNINILNKQILPALAEKGVELFSCEEPCLCGSDYADVISCMVSIMSGFVNSRKTTGYQKALAEGRVGRPTKEDEVERAIKLYQSGNYKLSQIEQLTGVSKSTLYKYLKD